MGSVNLSSWWGVSTSRGIIELWSQLVEILDALCWHHHDVLLAAVRGAVPFVHTFLAVLRFFRGYVGRLCRCGRSLCVACSGLLVGSGSGLLGVGWSSINLRIGWSDVSLVVAHCLSIGGNSIGLNVKIQVVIDLVNIVVLITISVAVGSL